jgi:ATP dependent DNA ligase domain
MECLAVSKLPEGAEWVWEIKLDGYRAIAVRSGGAVALFSRRKKSLSKKFPYIVEALAGLPAQTVVDGELVALDDRGRPEFNLLQNFRGAAARIHYYIFDLLWETVSGAKTPRLARAPRIRWGSDRLRVGVEAPGHTPSGMQAGLRSKNCSVIPTVKPWRRWSAAIRFSLSLAVLHPLLHVA